MTLSPESTLSKSLALLILLSLLLSAWVLMIAPIWQGFENQLETRSRMTQLLSNYESRIEPLEPLRGQLAAAQGATIKTTTGYLPSGNMAAVTSALQTVVRQHLEKTQGRLRSMQILAPARADDAEKFSVRIDFALPADQLLNFLYGLEATDPYLFLENVDIRSAETPDRNAAGQAAALSLRADIVGYARSQAAP